MSEELIQYINGYLEEKLSKKDLKTFLRMIEDSEEGQNTLSTDSFIHRLLNASQQDPVSTDLIMQALPREDNLSEKVMMSIMASENIIPDIKEPTAAENKAQVIRFKKKKQTARPSRSARPRKRKSTMVYFIKPLALAASLLIIAGLWKAAIDNKVTPAVNPVRELSVSLEPTGLVEVNRNEAWLPVNRDTVICYNEQIRTGERGRLVIRYNDDGSTIVLRSRSSLRMSRHRDSKIIYLQKGTLVADVSRQPEGQPMEVDTYYAWIEVLGTQFVLKTTPKYCRLEMREGSVRLERKRHASTIALMAGQCIEVDRSDKVLESTFMKNIVGHLQEAQLADIETHIPSAKAIDIDTLTYDSTILAAEFSAPLANAIETAREENMKFFMRYELQPEDCEVPNHQTTIRSLQDKVDWLTSRYDFDGIYLVVQEKNPQTSALLDKMTSQVTISQPGTYILAGVYHGGSISNEAWQIGY